MKFITLILLSICLFVGCGSPVKGTQDAYTEVDKIFKNQVYFKNQVSKVCFVGTYTSIMIDARSVSVVTCTPEVEALIINPPKEAIDLLPSTNCK